MNAKDTVFSPKFTLNLRGNLTRLSPPVIMGILNATPDSFYDGGRFVEDKDMLRQMEKMLDDGATIIDIGGYSSRPGAEDISVEEELKRTIHTLKIARKQFPEAHFSIDTFRAQVAEAALSEGASMINDISAGELDQKMFDVIIRWKAPYVMMHMRGTPQNMIKKTDYGNLLLEIIDYFQRKINILKEAGVKDIVVDPGFGFAKKASQSFSLLKNLSYFKVLEAPLLIGVSRKSMIYKTLGIRSGDALNGTTVLNTIGLMNGAAILRVHDVKEAMECVKLFNSVYS